MENSHLKSCHEVQTCELCSLWNIGNSRELISPLELVPKEHKKGNTIFTSCATRVPSN